jgi:uncharacterized protein (DUF58 family)
VRNARVPVWIAPRGIAALVVLALIAGVLARVLPWQFVAAVALIVAGGGLIADASMLRRLPVITRAAPAHVWLAHRDLLTYDVINQTALALRFGIAEAPVDRMHVDGDIARGTAAAFSRTLATIGFTPRERGRTALGSAYAWFESPLGLLRRRTLFGDVTPLRIMPDLGGLERGGDLARRTRLLEAGLRRIRRRGVGTEFESLREYASGDSFRAIDWKATARRGKVMVAQYEVERSQQIVVAIDAGRLMSARLGDRRKLDYAVSAALSISSIAALADDRVGLHAFASTTLAAIAPQRGPAHIAALTDALSDVEPHLEESDYERAALELRRRYHKRSLIVVFTDLFDPIASGAVLASLALLSPHHLVLVVLMNDAAIARARERAPAEVSDAYRAGIATTLADERERAVAQLRARGIGVVDVPAAELSIALLDAYVEIKSRSLL